MKKRLVALVGVFCCALLIVSGAYAGKPDKGDKPPRPGNITTECITFLGPDLLGHQLVEGCCPNAGPFPAYTMTLWIGDEDDPWWGKTFDGDLFAKPVTTRVKGQKTERYLVQFLTWDWETGIPGTGDYFFEFFSDGDAIDETDNVLTVTFNNDHAEDTATVWKYYDMKCDPCAPDCYDPCTGGGSTCDDFCDPDCPYPCTEEITIEAVSFVLERTSDLTHCR